MDILLDILNIIGVISFAAAGAMVAIDKETDIFGVLFLSITTCFGGGILRDVMISDGLPRFFTYFWPDVVICVITALVVFVAAKVLKEKYVKNEEMVNNVNNVLDAVGLGIFASYGTEICISLGIAPFASIVMGMLSAVGGGMLRDVLLRDIPFILRKRVYAVAALGGSGVYYLSSMLLAASKSREVISTILCLSFIFIIRMCATYFKWTLPKAIIFSEIEGSTEEKTPVSK